MRRVAVWFVVALTLGLAFVAAPAWPRAWLFDLYQRIDPPPRDTAQITIIDIDGDSVRQFGRWPWPRDRLAQLVDQARASRVIGLDILLLDSEGGPAAPSEARLAEAMGAARAALAATGDESGRAEMIDVTPVVQSGADVQPFLPAVERLAWPLPVLTRVARGTGLALILPEGDGIVRRLPTLFTVGATIVPSFALEVLRVAEGEAPIGVRAGQLGVATVSVGRHVVPTDPNGSLWPRFARDVPAQTVSAAQVLAGQVDPALLDGRIVLVGSSLAGLGDVHLTSMGKLETGTAIIAQLVASILAGDTLWRPAVAEAGEALLLSLLGIGSLVFSGRVPLRIHAALVGAAAVVLAAGSFAAFATEGLLLDWTLPAVGLAAINLGLGALRVRDDRRARRRAEAALSTALTEIEQARAVVTQALNSTKLATLGEMASVLAHELRQPIATMSMAAENAEAALQDGALDLRDARARIDRIIAQAKRAESMIEHLGIFARADTGGAGPIDLETVVRDALGLIEPTLRRHGIALHVTAPAGLPRVCGVGVLLEQVVINLCVNARDALREVTAGQRAIGLSLRPAERGVTLEVADTGPGIAGGTLGHIFEPFFTTKPAGVGVGLGLSVCRRIVESFGGTLSARNGPSGGAVFTVALPEWPDDARSAPP